MLRAIVTGPSTMLPQAITVIVPHLLSRDGSETVDAAVREQRKAQAEALASFIQSRQSPSEAIVVIGDFNAFAFNDGYVDVVGTVAGHPATGDQVATQTTDLVSPELVNLGDLMPPAERYSSVSNGNAQALDHALATANLASQFAGASRARINADFPAMLSGVVLKPEPPVGSRSDGRVLHVPGGHAGSGDHRARRSGRRGDRRERRHGGLRHADGDGQSRSDRPSDVCARERQRVPARPHGRVLLGA